MGCDIHGWVEKRAADKWVAFSELKDRGRNYERFANLAGVRGAGPEPKGIPPDASDTVKLRIERDGSDGHSHSFLGIEDAYKIFRSTTSEEFYSYYDAFGIDDDRDLKNRCKECGSIRGSEFRLVFWFDN